MDENQNAIERNKADHLILLIGGNPLPNAVAGQLLVRAEGTITLLHSGDTAATAQKLHTYLKNKTKKAETNVTILFKGVNETSPAHIVAEVTKQLNHIQGQSVGLHYTGGTKTMSVHAYRAVDQWAEHKAKPIYSYLDARTLSLIVNDESQPIPLSAEITLPFADLLALHGWHIHEKDTPATTPVLPQFSQALLKLYCIDNLAAWNEWKEAELQAKCKKANGNWKSKTQLNQITLNWPQDSELAELLDALQAELQQGADGLEIQPATLTGGFKKPEELCKQLDGGFWLETCVLQALQSIAGTHYLHDVCMNIRVPIDSKDFELDVIAMRDYQLFAFSCDTGSDAKGGRGHLKLKLFEAYVRAQQLGGDEARAALVCSADDPTGLEAEMRRDLSPHIKVFGRKHLENLADAFAQWIKPE
jgi:hypothetical protein